METSKMPASPLLSIEAKVKAEEHHSMKALHDLPSPPSSVSKASSRHSNGERDEKMLEVNDSSPKGKGRNMEANVDHMLSSSTNVPPPSPPPSTHSSEDLLSPILPSYFYPQASDVASIAGSSALSADEAPGVPVFEPTWEEFKDFYTFCQRIDEWGMKTGIVKIIPPREWIESLPRLDGRQGSTSTSSKQPISGSRYTDANPLSQVRIKNSIEQIFTPSGSGSWRQSNVVHPGRVINAKQWADICASDGQKGPEMSRMKDNAKREGEEGADEDGVRTRSGRGNKATPAGASISANRTSGKRKRNNESEKFKAAEEVAVVAGDLGEAIDDMPALEEGEPSKSSTTSKPKIADRTTQQEWDDFDYIEGWCQEAGPGSEPQDWNASNCKAIESEYWRGLNFGKAPMYGADLKGTLFTSATNHWNVGCLDNILTRLRLRRKLPGVTTPYLYFGMWRATFAWHVEDMDLYSINYIHFGAPKQWYAIRQSDRQRFELAMAGAFPGDSSRCRHFMRHKSYLASPAFLASAAGIKPLRLVQKAQEFVITYPYGYHSGFNLGFNCAESVNFALESWLDIGRKAGYCDCANDSVKMDVDAMLEESKEMEELDRKKEEKERKKEAEEKILQSEEERLEAKRAKDRERRRLRKEEQARLEALGLQKQSSQEASEEGEMAGPVIKKLKTQDFICVFCPSMLEEDLVVVPYPEEEKEKNGSRKPIRKAHRICASFVPETWIGANPKWRKGSQEPQEVVMGFEGIAKARWSLKCQTCLDPSLAKKGAKVQCTYGKCFRTSHVSCALHLDSGWMLDVLEDDEAADALEGKLKKVKAKDGSSEQEPVRDAAANSSMPEEKEKGEATRIVILCRSHNPREKEKEAKRRAEVLLLCVKKLSFGQTIKVRTNSGLWETTLQDIIWDTVGNGEGEILAEEEQLIKWSKIVFDLDIVKKAEEEQYMLEEERRAEEEAKVSKEEDVKMQEPSSAVAPAAVEKAVAPPTNVDEAELKRNAEEAERKTRAKVVEKEAKEAAKRVKEEEKRVREAKKMERMAEKAAKAAEREEKARVKEQRKAEKEQRAAAKKSKGELVAVQKQQGMAGQSGGVPDTASSTPSKAGSYDYIRNWKPNLLPPPNQYNPPLPTLPSQANEPMERQLAPLWHHDNSSSESSHPNYAKNGVYPSHLATYQNQVRPLSMFHFAPSHQHPQQQYHLPPHHHQQHQMPQQTLHQPLNVQSRPVSSVSNFQYASNYMPRQVRPAYAYHQQGQFGSQQLTGLQSLASHAASHSNNSHFQSLSGNHSDRLQGKLPHEPEQAHQN